MATANMQQDKVLVEGWWLKKAGKGSKSLMDRTKPKHRYFILTERYLDWYEKPGYPRKGTLPLDGIYVRKHGDNVSLVVGQFGGKEFKITSEGKDPAGRINDWYDRLTNQMDVCKQRNQHGADRKTIVSQGFGDMPEKAQVVATGQMTITQQPPPQTTLQVSQPPPTLFNPNTGAVTQLGPQQSPMMTSVISPPSFQTAAPPMMAMNPMVTVAPAPMMAPMATTVVSPNPFATVNPMHTTTAIGPYGQTTTYTSAPAPAPVTSTTTYGPYGAQTTYTSMPQPAPVTRTTTYGPFGTTVTQSAAPASAVMTCMACRAQFQAPMGGLVRCPFCNFVSGGASPMPVFSPTATVQVGYAPAPFY